MRYILLLSTMVIFSFISLPVWAQQQTTQIPQGWKIRFDDASASMNDIEFTANEGNLHFVVNNGAAIYYKPEMKSSGTFSVKATFTQNEKGRHAEAYGLFIGGDNLQEENQHYLYFEIRQDGKYLIKRRTGSNTETIVDWTASTAIQPMETSQPVTNTIKITRKNKVVTFWVNGTKIKQIPVSQLQYTEGVVGLRINHHLNVTVSNFELED